MFIWLASIANWIISTSITDGIISIVFNLVIFKLMAILAFLLIVD
jgi:hypothetical protein